MPTQNIQSAADFFNENWNDYKSFVMENRMCHREMLSLLNQFLQENTNKRPFTFVDVGCGDGSIIYPILRNKPLKRYIGIDIAEHILKQAPSNLLHLNCDKLFILDNMISAIGNLNYSVDIIYTSHVLNHLSLHEKRDFIGRCFDKLEPNGFLVMVEGILEEHNTREQLLARVEETYKNLYPEMTAAHLDRLMIHHRTRIFPERIETLSRLAQTLGWKGFRVLSRIDLTVFVVFSKSERFIQSIKLNPGKSS